MPTTIWDQAATQRHNALIEMNVTWLGQALHLVSGIDAQTFITSPSQLAPHKVGSHLRHILEFYDCFLDGLDSREIDYDSRVRDESVEKHRSIALARIRSIIHRLQNTEALRQDSVLRVRAEDAGAMNLQDPFLLSSTGRELLMLSSHTIHHFALIAVTLRSLGVDVDRNFGVAPSTLRHQSGLRAVEAA